MKILDKSAQKDRIKESHENLFLIHPEYKIKLSLAVKKNWELNKQSILNKQFTTKTKNKSWNTSKKEEELYQELCEEYGTENIIRQYRDEERYPYYCDFYIKEDDLFIELNAHWTHGGRPYNPDDEECQKQLKEWEEKAKVSKFYKNAIIVWTKRDVEKIQCAIKNNLNYNFIY